MKIKLPPIGHRILKSAIAIFICYIVAFLRGNNGIVFYSQLAALWCIQIYRSNTKKNAIQRALGTVIGAIFGLIYLLLRKYIYVKFNYTENFENVFSLTNPSGIISVGYFINSFAVSLIVILILYTTVLLKKKQASYFSCVVFLSIAVNHVYDINPYLFVWNRFLDTFIGIIIGVCVNCFQLPTEKQKDILFISGLDDTLLHKNDNLSDYSRIELNRMLDAGANFTISTMRTPASLLTPMSSIHLNLPVIAMDGAVLYDIRENSYLKIYVISNSMSITILNIIQALNIPCFVNVIIDDTLVIFYNETQDDNLNKFISKLRKSPYRNYVKSESLTTENVVYFLILQPKYKIDILYQKLTSEHLSEKLKIVTYDSVDYPGYSFMKIYNKNATRENMCSYLKQKLNLKKVITFGSIPEKYDIVINEGDTNKVVHELRKIYEPIKFKSI